MQAYKPQNILVTGGAGFIGSNFIHYLLAQDQQVRIVNLDKLTYAGSLKNLAALPDPARHHFMQGDINDAALVAKLLRDYTIDTIVHFAAESHVDNSIAAPAAFMQTNILGTFTLLEAARTYWLNENKFDATNCRFHHISTDEVYGSLSEEASAFTETTPYAPNSPYSASKGAADHLVRSYWHTYYLPITLSNCSNNYGPRQHQEKLIPTIIHACLNERPIPVYGDGQNIRDWLYVADHCQAIDRIISSGSVGESYNIGGNQELRNIDLVNKICTMMDAKFPRNFKYNTLIRFVADRPGHDWRYAIDCGKLTRELGWRPETAFDPEGLELTINALSNTALEKTTMEA
jgi:dTDP-glucose 4,6-dehydratase